ncbi:hypothetical protein TRAPUB_4346 [Trametes pubescens]|uniref:Uncharacterized protein n=1 Tax=Trametes pubescens TaxID=154538 RepID=A0A1M2VBE5_TRAPU|nr:hypothetical protein TRAPUB_4346 [Trametes pubescens]
MVHLFMEEEDTDLDSSLLEGPPDPIAIEGSDSSAAQTHRSTRLAKIHFPPELWMQICPHVEDQADLARLARVSSGMRSIAERTLYAKARVTRVTSASALYRFYEKIIESEYSGPYARRIQDLVVDIPTSVWLADWEVAAAVPLCLEVLVNLEHLAIGSLKSDMADWVFDEPGEDCDGHAYDFFPLRDEAKLLPRLRTLDAPASLLLHFQIPKTTITHLSLRMRWTSDLVAYASLEYLFGGSLVSLRIERVFECVDHWNRESPIRICAYLNMPRLEYLEIADTGLYTKYASSQKPWRGPFAANRVDSVKPDSPELLRAREGLPRLRELVWSPIVGKDYTRFSRGYGDGFGGFVKWMNEAVYNMGALPLETVAIRVEKDVFNFERQLYFFYDCGGNRSRWSPELASRWRDYEVVDADV